MGHLGFTPQSENMLGGRRIQGRGDGAYDEMLADALALQEAGACMIVLEMVISPVAEKLTAALDIPTIGIGAGPHTDGQVLVWLDALGMADWSPASPSTLARWARRCATPPPCLRRRGQGRDVPQRRPHVRRITTGD